MNEPHSPDILLIFEQNYVSNTQKEAVIFANFQITQIVDIPTLYQRVKGLAYIQAFLN